ncbi:MAG: phenylalanine 4-monooxygenase [Caulobacterales bacterium]|nr:phenylalanine 4-monooxygenase [Caulobacterales bacterium]
MGAREDFTIPQEWLDYTPDEHAVWDLLYQRQREMLPGRACAAYLKGLDALDLGRGGIPNFKRLSESLRALTGWEVVAVPCLVPDAAFFKLLSERRFPAGRFIRAREQLDYLQEPDVFHDVFGHVPMLTDPVFADYMQAYGAGGLRSLGFDRLKALAALYWYTVEFGLIKEGGELRIYGAGIVSSASESHFALESDSPNRVHFDLERVMRTDYRIDDFQQSYFVIDSFNELFHATVDTDFAPLYRRLAASFDHTPADLVEGDIVHHRGTQSYAAAGGRLGAAGAPA